MATAIARFALPQGVPEKNQCNAPRVIARRRGQLISTQGEIALVGIGDVFAHGCVVQCASGWLRSGCFVSIVLDDGRPLEAVVRWVQEDHAGLEFLRAIRSDRSDWQDLIALDV